MTPRSLALAFFAILLAGCREEILHDASERDANLLLTRLHEADIEAAKSRQADGRWTISVRDGEALSALKHLEENRMFKDLGRAPSPPPSVMSGREEQRIHYAELAGRELERTLGSLGGVLEARVHLNPARQQTLTVEEDLFPAGSASVLLLVTGSGAVSKDDVAALVGGAAGIPRENVAVVIRAQPPLREARAPPPSSAGLSEVGAANLIENPERALFGVLAVCSIVGGLALIRGALKGGGSTGERERKRDALSNARA